MTCRAAGTVGVLDMRTADKKKHPLDCAIVELVTNRYSGLLVKLRQPHNGYFPGEVVQVSERDFHRYGSMPYRLKIALAEREAKNKNRTSR